MLGCALGADRGSRNQTTPRRRGRVDCPRQAQQPRRYRTLETTPTRPRQDQTLRYRPPAHRDPGPNAVDKVMRRPTPPRGYDLKGGRPPRHGSEFIFGQPDIRGRRAHGVRHRHTPLREGDRTVHAASDTTPEILDRHLRTLLQHPGRTRSSWRRSSPKPRLPRHLGIRHPWVGEAFEGLAACHGRREGR